MDLISDVCCRLQVAAAAAAAAAFGAAVAFGAAGVGVVERRFEPNAAAAVAALAFRTRSVVALVAAAFVAAVFPTPFVAASGVFQTLSGRAAVVVAAVRPVAFAAAAIAAVPATYALVAASNPIYHFFVVASCSGRFVDTECRFSVRLSFPQVAACTIERGA